MKTPTTHFHRSLLPPPETFYRTELGELRRPNSKRWAQPKAGCPFHQSKSTTSFAVNLDTGGFYCFSCQAKGGDVVSFVMLRDKVNFRTAAETLGAWESHGSTTELHSRPAKQVPVADRLVCTLTIEGRTYKAYSDRWTWWASERAYSETLRRIYRYATDALTELGRRETDERFSEEGEKHWLLASLALAELRRAGSGR